MIVSDPSQKYTKSIPGFGFDILEIHGATCPMVLVSLMRLLSSK
jgi:hypothetical protein